MAACCAKGKLFDSGFGLLIQCCDIDLEYEGCIVTEGSIVIFQFLLDHQITVSYMLFRFQTTALLDSLVRS